MKNKENIQTQEGLDKLKIKAKYYGYYAENLQVLELIEEIESLRSNPEVAMNEASKKLGW
jgi:hypothetical protein